MNIKKINNILKNEKNKEIIYNIIGSIAIRGAALIISLLTLPAYMKYFPNQEILGVWYTMLAVLSWIMTFDFGIGNGLRNKLTIALVEKNYVKAKQYVSSAYIGIGILTIIVCVLATIFLPLVNWNTFFNINENILNHALLLQTIQIIFIGIMIQFWLKLVTSILYAVQKSAIPNLLGLCSSILLLVSLYVFKTDSIENNLIRLAYINILTLNIPMLIATFSVFSKKLKFCRPNIKYFDSNHMKDIVSLGGAFFWLQLMALLIASTNEFLITWLLSPKFVVEFQIYNKIFSLGTMFITLLLTPLWSAITKANAQKDFKWLRKLYKILIGIWLIAVVCEIGLALLFPFIVSIWLKTTIQISNMYMIIFIVFYTFNMLATILTSYVNGLGELKIELIFLTLGAILNFPLSFVFSKLTGSWISIVVANTISLMPFCIVQLLSMNKYFKKIKKGCLDEQ